MRGFFTGMITGVLMVTVSTISVLSLKHKKSVTWHEHEPKLNYTLDDISADYYLYNVLYFGNKLPHQRMTFRLGPAFLFDKEIENLATTTYDEDTDSYVIEINSKYDLLLKHADASLLHEMCHIATWNEPGHGPKWNKCMDKITKEGAFYALR